MVVVSRATVVIELGADAGFARDLAAGGVFVPGCALRLDQECDLLVCGANHQLVLPARVVYVDAKRGAGLELLGFSHAMKARLAELEPVHRPSYAVLEPVLEESTPDDMARDELPDVALPDDGEPHGPEPVPLVLLDSLEDDLALARLDPLPEPAPPAARATPTPDPDGTHEFPAAPPGDDGDTDTFPMFDELDSPFGTSADTEAFPYGEAGEARDTVQNMNYMYPDSFAGETVRGPYPEHESFSEDTVRVAAAPAADGSRPRRDTRDTDRPAARNVHERLRNLTLAAQIKLAHGGELHERVMLERLYGKNVWEALLRNPRLTAPEVSRIARYGSLPRVLLEIIVGNNAWLQIPEVRRALLSNPRLGADQVVKVLRLTPKHELRLAAIQTAYPQTVRNAAKMLLRE
jgi:hypothetical protein